MKQTGFLHKTILLVAIVGWSLTGNAQRYETDHGRVYYGEELLMHADARSFKDLGCGYAKDRHNVYLNGRVLENVDPSSFRLKDRKTWRHHEQREEEQMPPRRYFKTNLNVYYGDKKLDAVASSFKDLGGGYAKDAFTVYYCGEKVKGAMATTFKYTGDGYGQDTFDAYYRGRKIK